MRRRRWSAAGTAPTAVRVRSTWRGRRRARRCSRRTGRWWSRSSTAAAAPAAALFPPQSRDWALPAEANLTPHAAERVCREAARKSFDDAARSINRDWGTGLDGKQVQRWAEAVGDAAVRERDGRVLACRRGRRPEPPPNGPALMVVG